MTPKEHKAALGFIKGCEQQARRIKRAIPKMPSEDQREQGRKAAAIYAGLAKAKRKELRP